MKILVVSHNVFSDTESMGKTLSGYFHGFDRTDLAQFYIHNQIPTTNYCNDYYRITDKEVIQSILCRKAGRSYQSKPLPVQERDDVDQSKSTVRAYQIARKRTPLIYFLRNLWWKIGHWNNKEFRSWIDKVSPDCVFFASGDYAFMYDIALKIAKARNIPLYMSCMDDYYMNNKNANSILGRLQHKYFMTSVRKAVDYASAIFCICDKMSDDYKQFFHKKTITLHTPASFSEPLQEEKKETISYLGTLGYQRDKQLISIGKALKNLGLKPSHIDVYSTENRKEILSEMTLENGIIFHGSVDADEVRKIIGKSLAVVHTESFSQSESHAVRYSVSTKIADSLMSGTCIFAFGPKEIASMQYLQDNNAAICCNTNDDLENCLYSLLMDFDMRKKTIENAIKLGKKNHQLNAAETVIRQELTG